jgi:hypothetical protein
MLAPRTTTCSPIFGMNHHPTTPLVDTNDHPSLAQPRRE